jgi:S-adenosylmethionine synthetase
VSIRIEALAARGGDALPFEAVERKGAGHPDTIADAVAENVSLALCRHYLDRFGRVMHHNVDKALLWGGAAESAFGGGRILKPMELFVSGRATTIVGDETVPVDDIAIATARHWFRSNLSTVDVNAGLTIHSLIRPGSTDLVDLFERQQRAAAPLSNDTSIGVGFAPFSRLETAVDRISRRLNGRELRGHAPEIGSDIKILGVRNGEDAAFTVAVAFIDRHVRDANHYLERKAAVEAVVREVAVGSGFHDPKVSVNAADDVSAGSFYLTVTGTSAEAGDDGQAGRGNRINGLITPFRAMSIESYAGKNPVTHVGKLYNIAAGLMAQAIVRGIPDLAEAHCCLVGQIGRPVASPHFASVFAAPRNGHTIDHYKGEIARIVKLEVDRIPRIASELLTGSIKTDQWPLENTD